jgi:antirestriction protein ArdC
MCIINEFNNLDGKKVTRLKLQKLLEKAKLLKVFEVSTRLSNALKFNKEKSFIISIENPIQAHGLNAADQKLILPSLEYISEPDSEGLNGVSPDDIYSYITDLIINTIKKVGHLPWQKKWTGAGAGGGAKNYVSKKEYTGANFLLNFDIEIDENGEGFLVPKKFIQPYYLTFNQIKDAKASLKKGSKAHRVIYYTMIFDFDNGSLKFKTSDKLKFDEFVKSKQLTKDDLKRYLAKIPVLKYYNVFLADDCTGLIFTEEKPTGKVVNPIEEAQKLIDGYKDAPKYTFVGDKAYYQPSNDVVNMPKIDAFENEASYYCTYFHEIVHSTGAKKRLNRDFSGAFGSKNYAYEELIAELGAVFMCSEAGILFHTVENSAKYLSSWNKRLISALQDDNRFFLKASAQSKKAVNYILQNENPDHTEKVKVEETKTEKVKINPGVSLKTPVRKRSKVNSKNNSQLELFTGLNVANKKSGDLPKKAVSSPKYGNKKPLSKNKNLPKKGINTAKKVIEKPSEVKPVLTKSLNKNSLAYKMANRPEKVDYFDIQDRNFEKLLGQIEVKPNESVFISLTGGEGSMKTRMAFQFMNCFAQNYRVGHASIEEHHESMLYYDKAKEYLNAKALNNIHNPEVKSMTDLHKLIQDNDVIVIDSFTKMKEIEKSFEVDKDLRKKYNGKLFLVIFQQTTNGSMRGGSKSQFDADIVLFTEKYEDYTKNYVYATKNRYSKETGLKYNIFSKQLIGNVPAVKKLSFTVK